MPRSSGSALHGVNPNQKKRVSFNFIPREEVGILEGAVVKYLVKTGRPRKELGT